ncbi:MAG: response regulator [Rhodobacteraceae bacterium]|jgi:signal transduction histidine kinase|nr:response regulator [Paracoccaceae bacterium]
MNNSLINPLDSVEVQNKKLSKIVFALMNRVEQATDASGAAYAQFQRAAVLEQDVQNRTKELEHALDLLNESNAQLAQANSETEAARSNLANAIEAIQEGFALFDANDRLVLCNSRFGMHMPDIHDHLLPGLLFDNYVRMVSESSFLSLPPNETPAQWAERRLKRHQETHVIFNVRIIWNRWVQVSEHHTPDGGTVILQTDVSDIMRLQRQERERMLDDQAKLIRATLEHLIQGVCIFDNQARIVGWNHRIAELLPISLSSIRVGTPFETILAKLEGKIKFVAEMTPNAIQDWGRQKSGRVPIRFEIEHGPQTILDVFAQEMPDGGFVISFTDITSETKAIRAIKTANETLEQRVLERTLELEDALAVAERANASKSRFVAAASHDLLQPLSAAKLYIASLDNASSDERARDIIGKAGRALNSVENILEALLDISKLDSGRASFNIGAVSLGVILDQLRDEFSPVAAQKKLDLRFVKTNAVVQSDATYLRRILQNLIGNALRYTDAGKVLVGVRQNKSSVRVEVWDTGPGIPDDKQNIIFGEFQRLNASASAAEGMGLGLAIVERACSLLNHPLRVESKVGVGTGFLVEIPRTVRSVQHPNQKQEYNIQTIEPNLVALLIENDVELQGALTITMEQWGIDVLPVLSGSEAISLLHEIDIVPDVILADYQLDLGETGTDAIRQLWSIYGRIPAALITANRTQQVMQDCQKSGIELMYKPISSENLRDYIGRVSSQAKLR